MNGMLTQKFGNLSYILTFLIVFHYNKNKAHRQTDFFKKSVQLGLA